MFLNPYLSCSCSLKIPGVPVIKKSMRVDVHERPGTALKKGELVGQIPSWGPYFSLSFDLMVFKHVKYTWSSIIAFKGNDGRNNCCRKEDRIPAVFLNKDGNIHFRNYVSGTANYNQQTKHKIQLMKWHKVRIEQAPYGSKVKSVSHY